MFDPPADPSCGHPYRAYTLDPSGRIFGVAVVRARDDAQACRQARSLVRAYTIELWDRARFLGRFAPGQSLVMGAAVG